MGHIAVGLVPCPKKQEGVMEDKWEKVRQIVREECERIEQRIVITLQKQAKSKVGFKNGQFTGLGEIELAALQAAYPAVEVQKQLKEAAAWICMNPGEAPVSNYGKFLNTWLGRHQNRASIHAIPTARPTEIKQK